MLSAVNLPPLRAGPYTVHAPAAKFCQFHNKYGHSTADCRERQRQLAQNTNQVFQNRDQGRQFVVPSQWAKRDPQLAQSNGESSRRPLPEPRRSNAAPLTGGHRTHGDVSARHQQTYQTQRPTVCNYCGKPNHSSTDCRTRIRDEKQRISQACKLSGPPSGNDSRFCDICRTSTHLQAQCPTLRGFTPPSPSHHDFNPTTNRWEPIAPVNPRRAGSISPPRSRRQTESPQPAQPGYQHSQHGFISVNSTPDHAGALIVLPHNNSAGQAVADPFIANTIEEAPTQTRPLRPDEHCALCLFPCDGADFEWTEDDAERHEERCDAVADEVMTNHAPQAPHNWGSEMLLYMAGFEPCCSWCCVRGWRWDNDGDAIMWGVGLGPSHDGGVCANQHEMWALLGGVHSVVIPCACRGAQQREENKSWHLLRGRKRPTAVPAQQSGAATAEQSRRGDGGDLGLLNC